VDIVKVADVYGEGRSLYAAYFASNALDPFGWRKWTYGPQSWINSLFSGIANGTVTPDANAPKSKEPGWQFDTQGALDAVRTMLTQAVAVLGYNIHMSMGEEIVGCEYETNPGVVGTAYDICSCCKFTHGPIITSTGSHTFGAEGRFLAGGTAKIKFENPRLGDFRIVRRCNTNPPRGDNGQPLPRTKANCSPDVIAVTINQPVTVAFGVATAGDVIGFKYENTFAFEFVVAEICGKGGVDAPDPGKLIPPDAPGHEPGPEVPGLPIHRPDPTAPVHPAPE
jgi:hypothetical protein